MLLNVAAHNVSIRNIKVSKRERHITYTVTKHTYVSQRLRNVHFAFCNGILFTFCDAVCYVTFMFWNLYVLKLLSCMQLRFVTLRHVTFTLCCFTLCSNIVGWFWLSIVSFGTSCLLFVVMCGLSSIDCRWWLLLVLGCQLSVVDCLYRIPLSFSIVSAQLCLILISTSSWP